MKLIFISALLTHFIFQNLCQSYSQDEIKITGEIVEFQFQRASQILIKSEEKSLVMATNRVFTNEGNLVIEDEVISRQEFENTVESTFSKTTQQFLEQFQSVTTKMNIWIGYVLGAGYEKKEARSTKSTTVVTNGQTLKFSNTTIKVYQHRNKVTISAHQRVKVETYLETVRDKKIPFTADIRVTGQGNRFWSVHPLLSKASVLFKAKAYDIKAKVRSLKFNGKIVKEDEYSVDYQIEGYFKASYGLNFILKSTDMPGEQGKTTIPVNSTEVPNKDEGQRDDLLIDSNYLWPIIIILAIIAYIIKYIVKSKRRVSEPQNNGIPIIVNENCIQITNI